MKEPKRPEPEDIPEMLVGNKLLFFAAIAMFVYLIGIIVVKILTAGQICG